MVAVRTVAAGRLLQRDTADRVRYFGTLFGIALVVQGVCELPRDFNRQTVFSAMRAAMTLTRHRWF